MSTVVITKDCVKRLLSDIKEIMKNPLNDHGIFYKHDEENMLKGYVLIVPGEGTPYSYGYFMFKLNFPPNYPYSPPKATYVTNNGKTRFHPNYYTSGKVCLSLLNTWRGEEWSSCNTISSILLHMASIFTDKALLHEPGIRESHAYVKTYDLCIAYQTMKTAILDVYANRANSSKYYGIPKMFEKTIEETFTLNKKNILELLETRYKNEKNPVNYSSFYSMSETIDYKTLMDHFSLYLNN
jgi:ubiquitin-conjugating enzyme E2 Z